MSQPPQQTTSQVQAFNEQPYETDDTESEYETMSEEEEEEEPQGMGFTLIYRILSGVINAQALLVTQKRKQQVQLTFSDFPYVEISWPSSPCVLISPDTVRRTVVSFEMKKRNPYNSSHPDGCYRLVIVFFVRRIYFFRFEFYFYIFYLSRNALLPNNCTFTKVFYKQTFFQ